MDPQSERTSSPNNRNATQPTDISRALVEQIHPMQNPPLSSTPVELTKFNESPLPDDMPSQTMSSLPPSQSPIVSDTRFEGPKPSSDDLISPPSAKLSTPELSTVNPSESPLSVPTYTSIQQNALPTNGPSTENPPPLPQEPDVILGPILMITLLLTNGARHPYKIDDKYLKKRSVNVEDNNPANMSTYTLKELIWRDWREEWEARPSSPSSIRLIYYGKLLDDKMRLHDSKFSVGLTPHVVHMTVKPQDIVDEEDAKMKTGGKDREGSERSHGCRCVIL